MVGVDGVHQGSHDRLHRLAGDGFQFVPLGGCELEFEGGQTGRQGGSFVLGEGVGGSLAEQLLQRDSLVPVQGWLDEVVFGNADRVHQHEPGLLAGVRGDGLEGGRVDGAGAASLHLLEVLGRADVPHEEHAL